MNLYTPCGFGCCPFLGGGSVIQCIVDLLYIVDPNVCGGLCLDIHAVLHSVAISEFPNQLTRN